MPTPLTNVPVAPSALATTPYVLLPGLFVPFIVGPNALVGRGNKLGTSPAGSTALTTTPAP